MVTLWEEGRRVVQLCMVMLQGDMRGSKGAK